MLNMQSGETLKNTAAIYSKTPKFSKENYTIGQFLFMFLTHHFKAPSWGHKGSIQSVCPITSMLRIPRSIIEDDKITASTGRNNEVYQTHVPKPDVPFLSHQICTFFCTLLLCNLLFYSVTETRFLVVIFGFYFLPKSNHLLNPVDFISFIHSSSITFCACLLNQESLIHGLWKEPHTSEQPVDQRGNKIYLNINKNGNNMPTLTRCNKSSSQREVCSN